MFAYYFIFYPAMPERAHEDEKPMRNMQPALHLHPSKNSSTGLFFFLKGSLAGTCRLMLPRRRKSMSVLISHSWTALMWKMVGQICCMLQLIASPGLVTTNLNPQTGKTLQRPQRQGHRSHCKLAAVVKWSTVGDRHISPFTEEPHSRGVQCAVIEAYPPSSFNHHHAIAFRLFWPSKLATLIHHILTVGLCQQSLQCKQVSPAMASLLRHWRKV